MTVVPIERVGWLAQAVLRDQAAAVIATAISMAECPSRDLQQLGDVGIQTATWGPSVGLWQIRTLKAERGKGTHRDYEALHSDTGGLRQAQAMAAISAGGTNWGPWSVWWRDAQKRIGPGEGPYRRHLPAAREAVAAGVAAYIHDETPAESISDVVAAVPGVDALAAVARFAAMLTSWDTWRRILYVIAGFALLAGGVAMLAGDLRSSAVTALVGRTTPKVPA